jgi:oligosaccharide 4-alpha-D-glucosyltransferase
MSLLGMAYTHSDLGGFAGGDVFDQAMYIRWLQYGVFQPIYRPHAQDNIAPEVVFHDKETQDILRKFIKLRYKLLPYNYTLAYQNSTTGLPLMRPLFFNQTANNVEPLSSITAKTVAKGIDTKNTHNNLSVFDNANSYLWGDAFLVTPVVDANVDAVEVNLPAGVWFDYFTPQTQVAKKYQGNQTISLPTSLETLPVLVRGGSFIPMIDDIQSTIDYDATNLTVHYYADRSVNNASYDMYEDDGEAYQAIENGAFELLQFSAVHQQKLTLNLQRKLAGIGYDGMPQTRNMTVIIHNISEAPKAISINNKRVQNSVWQQQNNTLTLNLQRKLAGIGYDGMPKTRNMTVIIHNISKAPKAVSINKKLVQNSVWQKQNNTLTLNFSWQHQPLTITIQ